MKTFRPLLFLLVAFAQLAVPASMIWKRQGTLRSGRVWKFRTAPVDPVDFVRGRYLALRFTAEEFPQPQPMPSAGTAYVKLKTDADGFAIVDAVSAQRSDANDVIPVQRFWKYDDDNGHAIFPFDKFWVSEADAGAAERAYAANSRRANLNAYVTVRVHRGDATLEELYVAGEPLREYLRKAKQP